MGLGDGDSPQKDKKRLSGQDSTARFFSGRHHWHRAGHPLFVVIKGWHNDEGFLGVGAMNRLAAVAKRGLREAFRHPDRLCPFRPGVAVAMQRHAGHARLLAAIAKPVCPEVGGMRGQIREQDAGGRQVAQDGFQLLADGELRQRAGLFPKIGNRPGLPVNVLGLEVRGVGLCRAGLWVCSAARGSARQSAGQSSQRSRPDDAAVSGNRGWTAWHI